MRFKALAVLAGVLAALFTAPAYAATPGASCAKYTYAGTGVSLCADFPGSADRNCDDIGFQVSVGTGKFDDPWRLDGSGAKKGDGIGCESNPLKPKPTTSPSPSPSVSPSPSPSVSPSVTPTVTPSTTRPPATASTTTPPATEEPPPADSDSDEPALPVTGPAAPVLVAAGALVLGIGVALVVAIRRRRTRFEA